MSTYTKERMSVQSAQMLLEQSLWCLKILRKICTVLAFDGQIILSKIGDRTAVMFIGDEIHRQLTISAQDPLRHDIYACVLVRVQELGGVQNLPQCTMLADEADKQAKTMGALIDGYDDRI